MELRKEAYGARQLAVRIAFNDLMNDWVKKSRTLASLLAHTPPVVSGLHCRGSFREN